MKYLSIDVGTTCCKCQLWSDGGEVIFHDGCEVALKETQDGQYVDIENIVVLIKELIKSASSYGKIDSIAFSSLGESFVLLDKDDNILTLPMLYTDVRGEEQAKRVKEKFGSDVIFKKTGVCPHPMYSIYKLLWIKENLPDVYACADKLLLVGEYVGYLLTGERVIDYGLAARTGIFDVRNKVFCADLLDELGVSLDLFSKPMKTGNVVAKVSEKVANELNLNPDCRLVLGSHDQICATVGAGVINDGEAGDGMGTVECITSVFSKIPDSAEMGEMGYPIVPFFDKYCTYILNFSSGSLVEWYKKKIMHGYSGDKKNFFAYIEEDIEKRTTDLLMLPYFMGCATPYQDSAIKGAILNLDLNTSDADIFKAILEATSLEMRLNMKVIKRHGINVKNFVATGGGARSDGWLKIKSSVAGRKIKRIISSEGGLCGLAIMQAVAMGSCETYADAVKKFVKYDKEFVPDESKKDYYDKKFAKYEKLYHALKEIE